MVHGIYFTPLEGMMSNLKLQGSLTIGFHRTTKVYVPDESATVLNFNVEKAAVVYKTLSSTLLHCQEFLGTPRTLIQKFVPVSVLFI